MSVARQVGAGIDLVSDGEMAKISYATYIKDRITGFDGDSPRRPASRPVEDFPSFLRAAGQQWRHADVPAAALRRGGARRPTLAPLEDDLRALRGRAASPRRIRQGS